MSEMKVALKGLTCANCAGKIEDTLSKLSETQEVSINLLRQEMTVKLAPNASAEEMQETVERVVHKFEPEVEVAFLQGQKAEHHHAHHEHEHHHDHCGCGCGCDDDDDDDCGCGCGCGCGHDHAHGDENVFGRKFFLRFGIGLAVFLAAVFLREGTIRTILYICAYLIFGYDVLLRAVKHIGQGKVFDENFLMSFSTIGALYLGEMAEAVFVMLFYQVGEAFQEYAVARSRKSITALLDIRPDFAHLIVDGEERKVDPSLVQVGDMILVKAGERIPLDGVITEGHAMLDTAALTGESLPRSVGAGDQVLSGCINMDGSLKVRVEKGFGESTVMKILEMVENASAKKSKTEKFITRFARVYTPIVVLLAVLVAVLPPLAGLGKFSLWFGRALVFLVVSCPCALVLSVPLTYFAGIGAASKCGILVKGGGDLDTLKENIADSLAALRKQGIRKMVMLTGDRRETAAAVAEELQLDEFHSELLPENKVEWMEKQKGAEGDKTAFVGDGINDAPVLAAADLGIAMGAIGSDAAIEAADVVLMDDDIGKLAVGMKVARSTRRIVNQNVTFALGFKILVLLLSIPGIATMWMAVFADVGVCVLAILNAMRKKA